MLYRVEDGWTCCRYDGQSEGKVEAEQPAGVENEGAEEVEEEVLMLPNVVTALEKRAPS